MNNKPELKETDSGEDVTLLQQLLKINNYFPGSSTGVYGSDTTLWVKNYQKDNNLKVTGIATNETWELLYKMTTPASNEKSIISKPILQIGDEGNDVREVQIILKDLLYYAGDINGVFDETLYKSVQSFQYINKLVPEGVVGPDTWSALIDLYAPLSNCEGSYPDNEDIILYTVKAGDNLYKLAQEYGTTVDEIKLLNNLTSDILSIGQILIIPKEGGYVPPVETDTYTVQKGDTLYSIANKFNTTVSNIKALNNLTSDILSIGQVLKINGTTTEPEEPDLPVTTYTVQRGDTLYSIANKFNTTVSNIKALNNLTSDILSIGQVLKISGTATEPEEPEVPVTTYTVQRGDTLYSIANKFNTTVSNIKSLNNLTSDILSVGQVLKVNGTSIPSTTYTVQRGDTLYSIARKYNTTVENIVSKNNLQSTVLSIGQVLQI